MPKRSCFLFSLSCLILGYSFPIFAQTTIAPITTLRAADFKKQVNAAYTQEHSQLMTEMASQMSTLSAPFAPKSKPADQSAAVGSTTAGYTSQTSTSNRTGGTASTYVPAMNTTTATPAAPATTPVMPPANQQTQPQQTYTGFGTGTSSTTGKTSSGWNINY